MGQHYIPQFYLKGFCDPSEDSRIWVYEKGSTRVFLSSIKSVATENRRWPEKTEVYLDHEIEKPANLVLNKIRNHQSITNIDKQKLSEYLVVMLLRVPHGLQRLIEEAPEVTNIVFERSKTKLESLIKQHPEKADILRKRLDDLPAIRLKWESILPTEIWFNNLTPDFLPRVSSVFFNMNWTFLTSNKKHAFITSDNPVFYFEGMGLGNNNAQVFFPINSNIVLFMSWGKTPNFSYFRVRDTALPQINKRIASTASKYIYHSENNQGLVSLINKKKYTFMKLV